MNYVALIGYTIGMIIGSWIFKNDPSFFRITYTGGVLIMLLFEIIKKFK